MGGRISGACTGSSWPIPSCRQLFECSTRARTCAKSGLWRVACSAPWAVGRSSSSSPASLSSSNSSSNSSTSSTSREATLQEEETAVAAAVVVAFFLLLVGTARFRKRRRHIRWRQWRRVPRTRSATVPIRRHSPSDQARRPRCSGWSSWQSSSPMHSPMNARLGHFGLRGEWAKRQILGH